MSPHLMFFKKHGIYAHIPSEMLHGWYFIEIDHTDQRVQRVGPDPIIVLLYRINPFYFFHIPAN
jgi:hypothetical protein